MATQVDAARLNWSSRRDLKDAGKPLPRRRRWPRMFASEMAEKVCSDAIQIHGGWLRQRFPVERIYRDVRVSQIYEGAKRHPAAGDQPRHAMDA